MSRPRRSIASLNENQTRILRILNTAGMKGEGLTVAGAMIDVAPTTVRRILNMLVRYGFATREAGTPAVYAIDAKYLSAGGY